MKKKVSVTLAVMACIMFVACGKKENDVVSNENQTTESSIEDSTVVDGTNDNQAKDMQKGALEQSGDEFSLLLPRESDDLYFKPATDDYAYISYGGQADNGDGYYVEDVSLLSFNEDGEVIQEVRRSVSSYFVTAEDFSLKDYVGEEYVSFYTLVDDALYEDMISMCMALDGKYTTYDTSSSLYLKEKAEVVMAANENSVESYYFSKPDTNLLKTFTNEVSEDDIVITKLYPPVTDDYIVRCGENTDPDVVRTETVTCYDEKGNCVKYYHGAVFSSEQATLEALDRLKKVSDYVIRDGNTVVVTTDFDQDGNPIDVPEEEYYQKYYIQESDLSNVFFSKPYLSEEQFKEYVDKRTNY